MFGYIMPFRPELKIREEAQYRAAYCGLCHTLSKRYGALARFLVNYDFVLPAMLFWQTPYATCKKRCVRHPFRKHCAANGDASLDYSADMLMVFTDWKLRDTIADGKIAPLARMIHLLYRKAFRKAAERLPEEFSICKTQMGELRWLELQKDETLQAPASSFGTMLACLSSFYKDNSNRRAAHSLFTHLGRWIYVADAIDDKERDSKTGNYNAVIASRMERDDVFELMAIEQENAIAAFDLLPDNDFTEITRNILTLGLQSRGHSLYKEGRGGRYE